MPFTSKEIPSSSIEKSIYKLGLKLKKLSLLLGLSLKNVKASKGLNYELISILVILLSSNKASAKPKSLIEA